MKHKGIKTIVSALMAATLVMPQAVFAEQTLPASVKDHWSFESETSDMGDQTTGVLNGISIAESDDEIFGKVLRFGEGADKYMRLDDYLNTGQGSHAFSMWYRYDTSISESTASSAVLLQHEDKNGIAGKTMLSLTGSGNYHTYLNASNVYSENTVEKGAWQHVTISFDQETKKVSFYINGVLDSTKDLGSGSVNGVLPLRLGAHKAAGNLDPHPMRGDVDEFYVFNEAVDEEEALAIYAEKGLALEKRDAKDLVDEAKTLLAGLPAASAAAIALNTAISAVENAQSLAALRAAVPALSEAMETAIANAPLVLTVGSDTIRIIDPSSIFGINHRYGYNGYGTFDSVSMETSPEFKELYQQAGFGSIRYPGGSISNLFNWKTTLGSKDERKKQIHAYYNNPGQAGIAPNVGLCEISSFADEMDSELVYVYSFARGGAQDAADLIEYLNAAVGTNPNGGVDWAAVRAANGHPEPFNVRYFEIGNEPQMGGADGTSSQRYWIDYSTSGSNVNSFVNGATASFNQIYCADEEDWNKTASRTTGEANLVRVLRHLAQNPQMEVNGKLVDDPAFEAVKPGVRVYVGSDSSKTEWSVVDSMAGYGPNDQVCTLNRSNGKITFGDGVHGKIPAAGQNVYATYTAEREGFNAISQAMKETQAAINEKENRTDTVNVYSGWQGADFISLENQLGKTDLYDGMTVHPYSGSVSGAQGEAFYLDAMKKADTTGIGEVERYVSMLPEGKVPVISEYGIFRNTEAQVRSQTHALYIAKCLMEYAKLGSPYIQKHCLSDWYSSGADSLGPTQQAVIQVVPQTGASTATGEGSFRYFSTPSARVFEMINAGFGENLKETTISSIPKLSNDVDAINALASMDETGNVSILLENLALDKDYSFTLNLPESAAGSRLSVSRIEADSILDENSLSNPDKVVVTTDVEKEYSGDEVITVKKHSIVMIRIYDEADKKELNTQIRAAKDLKEEDWQSFTDLKNRLLQANLASENPFASQKEVDEKAERLAHAIASLKEKPVSIETAMVSGIDESYEYTGTAITPQPIVKLGDKTLSKDVDYTLSYTGNTEPGTASVTITGTGSYTGAITVSFTIEKPIISIETAEITGVEVSYEYTGQPIVPSPVVKIDGKTLVKGTDYTVEYSNYQEPGQATITITGIGSYSGSKTIEFTIEKPAPVIDTSLLELLVKDVEKADKDVFSNKLAGLQKDLKDAKAVLANPESQEQVNASVKVLHAKWLKERRVPDPTAVPK